MGVRGVRITTTARHAARNAGARHHHTARGLLEGRPRGEGAGRRGEWAGATPSQDRRRAAFKEVRDAEWHVRAAANRRHTARSLGAQVPMGVCDRGKGAQRLGDVCVWGACGGRVLRGGCPGVWREVPAAGLHTGGGPSTHGGGGPGTHGGGGPGTKGWPVLCHPSSLSPPTRPPLASPSRPSPRLPRPPRGATCAPVPTFPCAATLPWPPSLFSLAPPSRPLLTLDRAAVLVRVAPFLCRRTGARGRSSVAVSAARRSAARRSWPPFRCCVGGQAAVAADAVIPSLL